MQSPLSSQNHTKNWTSHRGLEAQRYGESPAETLQRFNAITAMPADKAVTTLGVRAARTRVSMAIGLESASNK